jgi:general transcription factor 3C polypeptide 5 (transcription factor C subunit 1)
VEKIRNFQLDPSRGWRNNDEIMPPPLFTTQSLPLVWNWEPDPPVEEELQERGAIAVPATRPRRKNYNAKLISTHPDADCPIDIISTVPYAEALQPMISVLQEAFGERPIWTREALAARVSHTPSMSTLRNALQYVGYRFTAGPWRDCLIKRGVDPRSDPKYRMYQTIYFRVHDDNEEQKRWHKVPPARDRDDQATSPFQTFDGKSFSPGNKVWQLCDISDPLLHRLITTAPFRDCCDNACDGWFTNGALAKIRSIMRTKLDAIQLGREVTDGDFEITLEAPDIVRGKRDHREIIVPLPNIYPSGEEIFKMSKRGIHLIRTGARKATIEKGALRSRNRAASRNMITTYEDSDDDLTAQSGMWTQPEYAMNSNDLSAASRSVVAATSDGDRGTRENIQQEDAVVGNWLSGSRNGITTESFYGAEEDRSDSGRSAAESDDDAQSDADLSADSY